MKKRLALLGITALILGGCGAYEDKTDPEEELFWTFHEKLTDGNFAGLYELLSADAQNLITEADFIDRHTRIVAGLFSDIQWSINEVSEEEEESFPLSFTATMETMAGTISRNDFEFPTVEENGELRVDWTDALIYPDLRRDDTVGVSTAFGRRGRILDTNGNALAEDGILRNIGIYPEFIVEEEIPQLAAILNVSEDFILQHLDHAGTSLDRISIATIGTESEERAQIGAHDFQWVSGMDVFGRVYKDHPAFGALLGYVSPITSEMLEADGENFYTWTSNVGRTGLELSQEETLRARDGIHIFIQRGDSQITVIERAAMDGKDVQVTIDPELQQLIYDELEGVEGAAAAIHPDTGEILALVSAPSANPNVTPLGAAHPLELLPNFFQNWHSPGSTFKLHTAAIGLENGTIDPNATMAISGEYEMIGGHRIARWSDFSETHGAPQIGLREAVIFSDNIYFAHQGLNMGIDAFMSGTEKFTIGAAFPIGLPIAPSQIANNGAIATDALLAETVFGQGEIMVTPLNIALDYSMLVANRIMNPILIRTGEEPSIFREDIVSESAFAQLRSDFVAAIEDPASTGHGAYIPRLNLAGKTGSAETLNDGPVHGWFAAADLDGRISIAMMVVDNAAPGVGGTNGVVNRVRNILDAYLD